MGIELLGQLKKLELTNRARPTHFWPEKYLYMAHICIWIREAVKHYCADFVRKKGYLPPFTDKILKVVFDDLPIEDEIFIRIHMHVNRRIILMNRIFPHLYYQLPSLYGYIFILERLI